MTPRSRYLTAVRAATITSGIAGVALSLATVGASAASQDSKVDKAGDVEAGRNVSAAQRATVDLRRVTFRVSGKNLVITTKFVDLAATPGNEFIDTEVGRGGSTATIVAEVGAKRVRIAEGGGGGVPGASFGVCKGSVVSSNFSTNVVRQVVPVRCLRAEFVRLKTTSLLARNNGSTLAVDTSPRSGDIDLK